MEPYSRRGRVEVLYNSMTLSVLRKIYRGSVNIANARRGSINDMIDVEGKVKIVGEINSMIADEKNSSDKLFIDKIVDDKRRFGAVERQVKAFGGVKRKIKCI